ncbi:MAG TPA: alpha,alpha-trehalase TreF [Sphingomonas sp.]|nr:alpha,alpha-trehalase TreF [Sphingomonas sp.]
MRQWLRPIAAASLLLAAAPATFPKSPAELYGPLYAAVETAHVFPDGKTFADAVAKQPPATIMAAYRAQRPAGKDALARFVAAHFEVPRLPPPEPPSGARPPIRSHIARLWDVLRRPPSRPVAGSSALPLPAPYVVPGGRFREIYYWDSYFTMLGLAEDGRDDLVTSMITDFERLIERYGHIPNGTRTYYLSRSQPPFFALMLDLARPGSPAEEARRLRDLKAEHDYWMAGARCLGRTGACEHVVRMPDGSLLNRYWDAKATPRDESYAEDVATARASGRPAPEAYRDLRAAAESGWDFSSRWLADGRTLATIRTTAIVPVDLNSLLWAMETRIAARCKAVRDAQCVKSYTAQADRRRTAIDRWLWNGKRFGDYDRAAQRLTRVVSAALLYPLFAGLADPGQAEATAALARTRLIGEGGLRTTLTRTGQQWDSPNGWAPLQWIAIAGLRRYGHDALAHDIARRWIATVAREYRASGKMLEKYDVEEQLPGGGGEYPNQDGFGWTNGVTARLIALYPDLDPR